MIGRLHFVERRADAARDRRLLLGAAMSDAFNRALTRPDALRPSAAQALRRDLMLLAQASLDEEYAVLERDLRDVAEIAHESALSDLTVAASDAALESVSVVSDASQSALLAYAGSELAAQTERDVAQSINGYRNLAIQVDMQAAATGMRVEDAINRQILAQRDHRLRTWFRDSADRRIPSQKFIRKLWRQTLRDHLVRSYLGVLATFGETTAVMWHPDPKHRFFGEMLPLDGDMQVALDEMLHPNSDALPVARRRYMEMTA